MKKKMPASKLSMFKDNLGFPLNPSNQNYNHTRKGGRPISNIRRPSRRGSGNPNAYQGGGGMGPGGEEGGRGEE
jgi:hypothetical protein